MTSGIAGDLAGTDLGLTPRLKKNDGVPTTDEPQKGKDFTSDQEVRWCPGCGDYVILNTIRNFLPDLGLRRETCKMRLDRSRQRLDVIGIVVIRRRHPHDRLRALRSEHAKHLIANRRRRRRRILRIERHDQQAIAPLRRQRVNT